MIADLDVIARRAANHIKMLRESGVQTRQGSFYTPFDVVEKLLTLSLGRRLEGLIVGQTLPRVIDPACGTGNFLVVAALQIRDRLVELGVEPETAIDMAVKQCIYGVDFDSEAVTVCRTSLSMLTAGRVTSAELSRRIVHANSLTLPFGGTRDLGQLDLFAEVVDSWSSHFPDVLQAEDMGFDVVIGNPPFLNQLETETVMDKSELRSIQENFGNAVGKMTNPSTVFLLIGQRLLAPDGSLVMIQPLSFIATAHSAAARRSLAETGQVREVWVCLEKIFDASVQVIAVHLDLSSGSQPTEVLSGRNFENLGRIDPEELKSDTWSVALTRARNFPEAAFEQGPPIETVAKASAAFRDQYYGLVGAVVESGTTKERNLRLATVRLVDPAVLRWGQLPTRFAKTVFERPVVVLEKLDDGLQKWAESMICPKVIVATQTKVIECVVDEGGDVLPGVPLVTIRCEVSDVWKVAAALSAPPVSLLAAQRHLGAGMSSDVLRVTAQELLALPLPVNESPWTEAADVFRQAQEAAEDERRSELLLRMGRLMCDAYGVSNTEVFDWWASRLPSRT